MLVVSAGLGLMFVPLTLMVVSHVRNDEQGAASGVLNVGQQIGGADRARGHRHDRLDGGREQRPDPDGERRRGRGDGRRRHSRGGALPGVWPTGSPTASVIAGLVTLVGLRRHRHDLDARPRAPELGVHQDGRPSCDEALGTCEGAAACASGARVGPDRTKPTKWGQIIEIDPDGNGIELYLELRRQEWPGDRRQLRDGHRAKLDLEGLLAEADD